PKQSKLHTPKQVEEIIIYLRKKYHFGQFTISHYLRRYHDIKISVSGIYCVLKRYNMNRLPRNYRRKISEIIRYEKQTPGHHVQMDVKFLIFNDDNGNKVKRFQYTAIDDSTRVRALKIYDRHTQKNAINFADYVVEKFPFRIHTIRTDNGHEFRWGFHLHVKKELGINHVYIKPASPHLNGKVERSHGTDEREFYQLFSYKEDVDLEKKLKEWENYYNYHRPHSAINGKTPYELLREKLNPNSNVNEF
ncbi:MAG: integrase core domain-containing protein, partial [Thermodesulfobacteriota bacterium]